MTKTSGHNSPILLVQKHQRVLPEMFVSPCETLYLPQPEKWRESSYVFFESNLVLIANYSVGLYCQSRMVKRHSR